MNVEEEALWQRLNGFKLDIEGSSAPFSKRLAKENRWQSEFAGRVIEEYKRYCFLAVAAGHPVSPSDAVDQVWHLHLLYTENYWKGFCGEILRMPFHHGPSKGGRAEHNKFEDWYRRTLESYERFFGCKPPEDIWPDPVTKSALRHDFVRVNQVSHWVVPKPNPKHAWLVGVGVVALGCTGAVASSNPFDSYGPDFLGFYFVLFAVCFGAAFFARHALSLSDRRKSAKSHPVLDGFEIAYLSGGKIRAVNAAIADLVNQGILKAGPTQGFLTLVGRQPSADNELQRAILGCFVLTSSVSVSAIRVFVEPTTMAIEERLREKGLYVPEQQSLPAIVIPLLIAFIAPVMGAVKVSIGISRHRPVDFLIILCVLSTVAILATFARKPARSQYGDSVLHELRTRNQALRHYGRAHIPAEELIPAIGLFGFTVLQGSVLGHLARDLRPMAGSSSCGGGGCSGSGCSGGGGSCGGGGGCGGGGCGGCGGG